MKNTNKYLSYTAAWARIKQANEQGFHFEAVTICESIISDRLLSYLAGTKPGYKPKKKTSFGKLIAEWGKSDPAGLPAPDKDGLSLPEAVDLWRGERNKVVHGLVKSEPESQRKMQDFLALAEKTAKEGASLARKVCDWHKAQLCASKKIL
ncbi:MAG: hypothetical protein R3E67_07680 [Pseudomonadales bacterium]